VYIRNYLKLGDMNLRKKKNELDMGPGNNHRPICVSFLKQLLPVMTKSQKNITLSYDYVKVDQLQTGMFFDG